MDLYLADTRTPCKYGEKCYQKNPQHHKRFKHPPNADEKKINTNKVDNSPPSKKFKADDAEKKLLAEQPQETNIEKNDAIQDDVDSDSESENEDEDILLPCSPQSVSENIKQKFLVDMPKDFYDFWDFCKTVNTEQPEDALCKYGLKLVGAFDLLSGKLKGKQTRKLNQYLCHWRFFYDPPEFQTVIVGDKDGFHIGYFRDDPEEDPVFMASITSSKNGTIHPMKEDLFSSIYHYIKDNFKTVEAASLRDSVKTFAEGKNYKLDHTSDRFKARKKKVVSKSFHGAGIVVPVDKKTDVGYREIPETSANLRKIMKNVVDAKTENQKMKALDVLQELMTNAQWATDEGDFGMGLELGIDLFIYGSKDFHSFILHLLTVAYDLLNRQPFAKIIKAHLKNRRTGSAMSTFDPEVE